MSPVSFTFITPSSQHRHKQLKDENYCIVYVLKQHPMKMYGGGGGGGGKAF
jgi:hypothetical protein